MSEARTIQGLIAYIESYQPELLTEMSGADDVSIYELERIAEDLSGVEFPFSEEYLEFLRLMGGKTPLPFAYDAKMEATEIQKIYEIRKQDGDTLPKSCILIAAGGFDVEQIALEIFVDDAGNLQSGRVFSASEERLKYALADSFINFLFRRTFEFCAFNDFKFEGTFIGLSKEPSLEKVSNFLTQFGWQKLWFSDSVSLAITDEKTNVALYAQQLDLTGYAWLKLAGNNKEQLTLLGKKICQTANMEFEKWW